MVMRNPLYLDLDLLQNAADYHDIPTGDVQIVETDVRKRDGSVSATIFDAGLRGSGGSSMQTQTSYEKRRPVLRVMNDVVDHLLRNGLLKGRTDPLGRGELIEVDGEFELTTASEVGIVLGKMLPMLLPGASAGVTKEELKDELAAEILRSDRPSTPLLFELITDDGLATYVELEPANYYGTNGPDEIAGDLTVFAVVDRIYSKGEEVPIEKWLMPNAARVVRRQMAKKGLDEMVAHAQPILGDQVSRDYRIPGPAVVLKPVAIY